MYVLTCLLLVPVICVVDRQLISCSNTDKKCGEDERYNVTYTSSCDSDSTPTSASTSAIPNHQNRTLWQQTTEIWRKIWNANGPVGLQVFRDDSNNLDIGLGFEQDFFPHRDNAVSRTFGIRRRMQLLLFLPISFKLGVMLTLLLVLTTISLKTLLIGFIILLLLLSHTNHPKLWGPKTAEITEAHKNVHIHVHTMPDEQNPHQYYAEQPWQTQIPSSHSAVYHV